MKASFKQRYEIKKRLKGVIDHSWFVEKHSFRNLVRQQNSTNGNEKWWNLFMVFSCKGAFYKYYLFEIFFVLSQTNISWFIELVTGTRDTHEIQRNLGDTKFELWLESHKNPKAYIQDYIGKMLLESY